MASLPLQGSQEAARGGGQLIYHLRVPEDRWLVPALGNWHLWRGGDPLLWQRLVPINAFPVFPYRVTLILSLEQLQPCEQTGAFFRGRGGALASPQHSLILQEQ